MGTPSNAINVSTAGLVKFNTPDNFSTTTITEHATLVGGATNAITSLALGTAGHVLTSNGAGVDPSYQAVGSGSGAVIQINGDTGSATPAAGVITLDANTNGGASVLFSASGSTVSLQVSDADHNTFIGKNSGNGTLTGTTSTCVGDNSGNAITTGSANAALGQGSLQACTTGSSNVAIGGNALQALTTGSTNVAVGNGALLVLGTGSSNTAIGDQAGISLTGTDSSNILIKNNGTLGDNNTTRIGTQGSGAGQQNRAFIAGITGVTTTVANRQLVTVNSSTTQVGTSAFSTVIQVFSANGTYTPTSGMVYCEIEILGGGGGGGGCGTTTAAQFSGGAGGGGGEYASGMFSAATVGASQSVTIGAAGAANSGATGGNGGNSSVGALISANGGTGGATVAAATGGNGPGGLGGTGGSGGTVRTPGQPGFSTSFSQTAALLTGPNGGSSQYGAGGLGGVNATGGNGLGFGSGGGGSTNAASAGAARAGGAGATGYVKVTEYVIA